MDTIAEVRGVSKRFGSLTAVDQVSFKVVEKEILGLVGPNGSGKTTTIRMLLDILPPDEGECFLLGKPPDDDSRHRVGYLPEERGLYRELRVMEMLEYLAALKGLPRSDGRAEALLRRVGLWEHRNKKTGELSRGMLQLVQFIASIQHRPRLAVLDEPFSGLDPVNVRLLTELVLGLREEGTAFILSTHQMNMVEELCDRVAMVHRGRLVLYGTLQQVKAPFQSNLVFVVVSGPLPALRGVARTQRERDGWLLALEAGVSPRAVLSQMVEREIEVLRFEVASLPLEEIFVRVVSGEVGPG